MTKSGFDIDEIERLLAAATGSGIWAKRQVMDGALRVRTEAGSFVATVTYEQDAALIVTLHNSAAAMIAKLRELRAENARLREMTATNKQAWDNALEFGLIPERHRNTVQIMSDGCRAALGEPQ